MFASSVEIRNFNSIKVQLEHSDFDNQPLGYLFQFHKGTIRTGIVSKRISGLVVISIP